MPQGNHVVHVDITAIMHGEGDNYIVTAGFRGNLLAAINEVVERVAKAYDDIVTIAVETSAPDPIGRR